MFEVRSRSVKQERDKIEKAGAVWVIGVSAPAVVTGI
jgi:hypothetical protein